MLQDWTSLLQMRNDAIVLQNGQGRQKHPFEGDSPYPGPLVPKESDNVPVSEIRKICHFLTF